MFLVSWVDSVVAQDFPNKQIHADPKDCPTIVDFHPFKWKEHAIKTEPRKQNEQHQNKQLPKQSATEMKGAKSHPTMIMDGVWNHSQTPSRLGGGVVVS